MGTAEYHQRSVGPALGENGDGIDVGSEQGFEVFDDTVKILPGCQGSSALWKDVGNDNAADTGVELEELGELAGELTGSNKTEGNGHRKAFLKMRD
jgi:hypothetical protein